MRTPGILADVRRSQLQIVLVVLGVASLGACGLVVALFASRLMGRQDSPGGSGAGSGWSARWIGDVDGDGSDDVPVSMRARPGSIPVSGRTGTRIEDAFGRPRPENARDEVHRLGDLDGDGRGEIAWDARGSLHVREPGGEARSFRRRAGGLCAPISDLDGDGVLDLAIEGFPSQREDVGRLSAVSSRTGAVLWIVDRAARPPRSWSDFARSGCAVGDVDGDGFVDLAVHADGDAVEWVCGRDGRTIRCTEVRSSPGPASLARHGDLDGDGQPELLVAGPPRGAVRFLSGADGSERSAIRAEGGCTHEFSPGDVDGDGRDDVAWTTETGGEVVRALDGVRIAFLADAHLGPGRGDADGDGRADLLAVRDVEHADARTAPHDLWRAGRVEVVSGRTGAVLRTLDAASLGL